MKKRIKHMNDFVLGILMVAFSAFLIFGRITEMEVQNGQGGFFARSDIWLGAMGVLLLITAVLLIIRSINFKKLEDVSPLNFYMDSTVIGTTLSLIVYAIALPKLGFFITTYVVTFYLVLLYSVKENGYKFTTVPKNVLGKMIIRAVIVSAIFLVILLFVFGKLLAVQLPAFALFD